MADDGLVAVEGQTSVKVAIRCRPLSQKEINEGGEECVEIGRDGQSVTLCQDGQAPHSFAFDHVFGKDSTQPEVFEKLGSPLLDKAFEGYNATIFAYGQTGSGKTHTMMSDRKSDDRGLIPRISEDLFERIKRLTTDSRKFLVTCSFLEIYNEIVYDLLVPRGKSTPKTGLEIREQKGIGVYVKDLQEIVVDNSERLQKLIDQGFEHRATAATQMNATSSRSHCLFIIKMHQKDEENASNNNFSKMNLVDLAGSERASRTGAQGDTLKEGANINKSLSSLGNVINALSKMSAGSKKVFIPYRDSKLTRVLQESLGGNALTTMMAAMSPAKTNYEETLSTLNYAKRAKTIKVNATKNEESEQIARLEEEVEQLRAKLAAAASGAVDSSKYEAQIEEMERFMKQTWDDKEQASKQHEEQRRALEAEAQRNKEKALEEKNKRLKLLEEKGDIELSIQELRSQCDGASSWGACSDPWPQNVSKVLALEQRIAAQCRAVALCRDAVMQDLSLWREQRKSEADDGSAASRMLLQQAERKTVSVLRELGVLEKHERELERAMATLVPEVRRMLKGVNLEASEVKDEKEESKEGKDAKDDAGPRSEEIQKMLSLIDRQLEAHRAAVWSKIAEDHRPLATVSAKDLKGLLDFCQKLGKETSSVAQALELEVGGSSGSKTPSSGSRGLGAEAIAALGRPLGLASGELGDAALSASSNKEAAGSGRLLDGVPVSAFGGWCPAKDAAGEYLQVDLGAPRFVCGVSMQGRTAATGEWQRTRPLVGKVIEPDPLPPERVFKRPPVRLIHDVVVAAHVKHKALVNQAGLAEFSKDQLDYKALQKADRQFKVDFFDLVLNKVAAAIKAAGFTEEDVPPLQLTSSDILGGKNTLESNRLLQLLSYIALRERHSNGELGGLLSMADSWVTKFTISWSVDGSKWGAIAQPPSEAGQKPEPMAFEGNSDATTVNYLTFGPSMPSKPVRFLRVKVLEWQRHAGLRIEVHGWPEDVDVTSLEPNPKAGAAKVKGADKAPSAASLADRTCRLDVVRSKIEAMKRAVEMASAATLERWKEMQKAEAEKNQQALDEKTQVEQQLADARHQLEELMRAHNQLQDKAAETEQRLIETDTEKLKLEVDRDRAEMQLKALEEKLDGANAGLREEKKVLDEHKKREEELKAEKEDLQMQIAVLTEERDAARRQEEELWEKLEIKEEQLMITDEGYVRLSDQIHEMREEFDDKVEQRDKVIDTLNGRNQELLNETINLRKELAEWKRKLTDAEKAIYKNEQGLPVTYRYTMISAATTRASTPNGPEAGPPEKAKPPEESKRKKKSSGGEEEYEEDFDEE